MNTDNHTHQGFKNRLEKHPYAHHIKRAMPWLCNVAERHQPYVSNSLKFSRKPFLRLTGRMLATKPIGKKVKVCRPVGPRTLFLFLRFGSRAVPDLRHLIPRGN